MSSGDEPTTVIIEKERGSETLAFLLGAVVGAGLALLFAPQSGEKTQEQIREGAKKLREATGDRVRELREEFGGRVDSVKGVVEQGRQAAVDARADLEAKLERSKEAYRAGVAAAREVATSPTVDDQDETPEES